MTFNVCPICSINVAISGIHLPSCPNSDGSPIEINEENDAILKFSNSIVAVIEQRVITAVSLIVGDVLEPEELEEFLNVTSMASQITVMMALQVLLEQELLDEEKVKELIQLFDNNFDEMP